MIHSSRTGHPMGNLRTANKRHKRAEAAKPAAVAVAAPVTAAPKKAAKTKA